jgi:hypothetical protein
MTGRHRNPVPISPALVLKLVRDKVAATRADLIDYLRRGRWFLPESALRHELDLASDGLLAAGLLRDDSLVLEATELTDRITKALKIRLTDLSEWDESSIIAHPAFSSPVPNLEPAAVFMVMPFTTALELVYQDHIRRVCDELSLSLARADDFYSSQSIVAGIWSAIYFSTLVVADCTGRNPNVFYEIGIAHQGDVGSKAHCGSPARSDPAPSWWCPCAGAPGFLPPAPCSQLGGVQQAAGRRAQPRPEGPWMVHPTLIRQAQDRVAISNDRLISVDAGQVRCPFDPAPGGTHGRPRGRLPAGPPPGPSTGSGQALVLDTS